MCLHVCVCAMVLRDLIVKDSKYHFEASKYYYNENLGSPVTLLYGGVLIDFIRFDVYGVYGK